MIGIQGPDLFVKGTLTPDTRWVRVYDHYSVKGLDNLLKDHGCQQTKIFQDFFWLPVDSTYETVFAPVWLGRFCDFPFVFPKTCSQLPDTHECFNFMVYKLRPLRHQAIQAVLDRGLTTECYTYPKTNYTGLKIKPKSFKERTQEIYNNIADYNDFLKEHVFDHSAVSLITETIEPEWQNNMTFTEKTLWAMLGLNFPIWLGGYRQADLWKQVGFDTFDDVVDHSYQWDPDPAQRIHQALDRNIRLLTDLAYVSKLRHDLQDRLYNNQKLVLQKHIVDYQKTLLNAIDIPSGVL
jgi:plasmid stabilization system protein ParE